MQLQQQLSSYGIENELFEGSYGNVTKTAYAAQGRSCHHWGIKGPEVPLDNSYREVLSTPGVIGCFDSHYRLWEKCVNINQPIIIFEDDAVLERTYYPVEWIDVLSLASSHSKKMGKYIQYLNNPSGEPIAKDYGQSSMPGNAGYAIKPHAARKLINEYKHSFLPADNAINQHIVRIQIHSHMMGRAQPRDETDGKSSLVRTKIWDTKEK